MNSNQVQWIRLIGGVVLLLIGLVWALQGIGVLGGSAMSGQSQWLVIGAILAAVGAWLILGGLRGRAPR